MLISLEWKNEYKGKWQNFISSMAAMGKTDIREMESWSASKSVTKPVSEAGPFHGEWNSVPSWPTSEEKCLTKFFC